MTIPEDVKYPEPGWSLNYPIGRDNLARHLYVYEPLGPEVALTRAEQDAGAEEWDSGQVKESDVLDAYERADALLAARAAQPRLTT